ncbi:MAG: hypothetical protein RIC30_11900 [Marinoscillum sp.]|uniref:hypothetical protein n=1 Tax=Marinoscillum sp. TaxID=2024838 RepID=UPI0033010260
MKRAVFMFGLALTTALTSLGQGQMEFLSAPITDEEYIIVQMTEDFLSDHKFGSPWLRDLDFRVRSSGSQIGIEEYRMRLGLINPLEIKANRDYKRLVDQQFGAEKREVLNDVMLRRYEILLEHAFLSGKSGLLDMRQNELQSQSELLLGAQGSLNDLIDVEESLTKLGLEGIDIDHKIELVMSSVSTSGVQNLDWGSFDIIPVDSIWQRAQEIEWSNGILHDQARRSLALKEQLLKIDRAEAFSNLGFIQGEYDLDRGDLPADHLGFQVGLTIPIFNSDKPQLERKKLALIDDQVELQTSVSVEKDRVNNILSEMGTSYLQLQLLKERSEKLNEYRQLNSEISGDLDTYIKLSELEYFMSEKSLNYESSLRMNYIRLLHLKGKLAETPLINYLSVGEVSFELK